MGCGWSCAPQDKDGQPVETATGIVPVPGQKTIENPAPPNGKPSEVHVSDDEGNEPVSPLNPNATLAAKPIKGTVRRLYNPMRIPCPFEEDDSSERTALWNLLRGQSVVVPPGPPTPRSTSYTADPKRVTEGQPLAVACDFGTVRVKMSEDEAATVAERPAPEPGVVYEPLDLSALRPAQMLKDRSRRARVAGVKLRHVTGHCRAVKAVGLSGDGRLLVSGDGIDARQALRCVDTRTSRHVGTLNGYRGGSGEAPCDLSFSTNGQQLATCDQSDILLLWDMTTFRCKKTLQFEGEEGNELFLIGVRMSPDSRTVAAAAEQSDEEGVSRGRVVLWDLEQKTQKLMFSEHTASVLCLSFSPDSKLIASGSRDGQLFVWHVEDGSVKHKLGGHASGVRSCAFNHDGNVLLTNDARVLCLWDVDTGQPRLTRHIDGTPRSRTMPDQAKPDNDVTLSKTRFMVSLFAPGGLVMVAASDKQVRLFDGVNCEQVYQFATRAPVTCASSANSAVALGDVYGNVYVAELLLHATEERVEDLPLPSAPSPPPSPTQEPKDEADSANSASPVISGSPITAQGEVAAGASSGEGKTADATPETVPEAVDEHAKAEKENTEEEQKEKEAAIAASEQEKPPAAAGD